MSRSISLGRIFITMYVILVRADSQLVSTVPYTLLVCVILCLVTRDKRSPRWAQMPGWLLISERTYVTQLRADGTRRTQFDL